MNERSVGERQAQLEAEVASLLATQGKQNEIARGLAAVNEMMGPLIEAVLGYRQRFIDAGVAQYVADGLAWEYHAFLLSKLS